MKKLVGVEQQGNFEKNIVSKSINDVVNEQVERVQFKHDVEKEQQAIFDDFLKWVDKPFPKFLDQHDIKPHELIILVYGFKPKNTTASKIMIDVQGGTAADLKHRTFSIAKVLKAGIESGYEAGDFVKLYDFQVASIENPEYSMWNNNEYSKSNLKKIGQEPPKFLNNIGRFFGPKMIALNPLKAQLEEDDFLTFKVNPADISNKINDVRSFVG
jgi:hypothetical protein